MSDVFTPEGIAKLIERARQRDDVRIEKIEDKNGRVTVTGGCQVDGSWDRGFYGILFSLKKASPTTANN